MNGRGEDAAPGVPGEPTPHAVCDGGDLDCGSGLLLIIRKAMDPLAPGQILEVRSREPSVRGDLPAWCRMVSHEFLGAVAAPDTTRYFVRKGGAAAPGTGEAVAGPQKGAEAPVGAGIASLEEDLEKARHFQWAVRVRRDGDGGSRAYARSHTVTVGPPLDFGFGRPDAPLSAVEYLLASLGACLVSGFQVHASRRGVTVYEAELALRGSLNNPLVYLGLEEEGHPGFAWIGGTFYVSADADEDVLHDLWSVTLARSPIANTLRGRVELDVKFSVVL